MFNGNSNGSLLARLIAGLIVAVTVVAGSLGHAVYTSQAFF